VALRDIGFTSLAERVYRVLLTSPAADPSTLADAAGCSEKQAQAALDALLDLGVIKAEPTRITVFSPASALGALIERREDELLQEQRRVGDTRAEVNELTNTFFARPEAADSANGVERIEDLDKVRERLEELAFFTRASVWSVQPGYTISRAALAASRPLDLRGLRRGIDMRTIYNTAFLQNDWCRAYVRDLTAAGAKARFTDEPLERMIIMDDQVAMLPIDPGNSRLGALIVRQPGLLTGFVNLFHRLWNDAVEMSAADPPAAPGSDLSTEDREILALLAEGKTDELAARSVGISVRHLRRRVARLMDQLDASSRFEAGVEAARRGWI
jgi:sugar-specific transcriptional regulator TrmB/DNA-binding CsgD family transcriptional regulator